MFWFFLEAKSKDFRFIALKYPFYLDAVGGKYKLLEKEKTKLKSIVNLNAFVDQKYQWFRDHLDQLHGADVHNALSPTPTLVQIFQGFLKSGEHGGKKFIQIGRAHV